MNLIKNGLFWAIISIVFGLLCIGAGDKMQFVGAFFIAVGICSVDLFYSEKKEVKK